jgi:tRNA/rRNA methyltransferase
VDVVLVEPQKSENIGAAARAMANTGLGRLVLVRPRVSRPELMEAAATRLGEGILRAARVAGSLAEAVAPYPVVAGTTARAGAMRGIQISPRRLAPELLRPSPGGGPPPPACLVFGTERDGLSNEDLRLCTLVASIPTSSPELSSLNLAQAVLILGYELLLAAGAEPPPPLPIEPALSGDFEEASGDLMRCLWETGFLPETDPGRWFENLKKIFRRSGLTRGECDLLRGICRQTRWVLKNGRPPGREAEAFPGGPAPGMAAPAGGDPPGEASGREGEAEEEVAVVAEGEEKA